jgi:hypothetical protein
VIAVSEAADALVIFGITGDLARKMTFRSPFFIPHGSVTGVRLVTDRLTAGHGGWRGPWLAA